MSVLASQLPKGASLSSGWSQASQVPWTSPTDARCPSTISNSILLHSLQHSSPVHNRVSRRMHDKLLLAVNSHGRTAWGAEL